MFDKKELVSVGVVTLILSALLSVRNFGIFWGTLLAVFLVIIINVFAKKIAARILS